MNCIDNLIKEQQNLCQEIGSSTLSATRLQQRLIIARRYFTALSRYKSRESNEIPVTPKAPAKEQKT